MVHSLIQTKKEKKRRKKKKPPESDFPFFFFFFPANKLYSNFDLKYTIKSKGLLEREDFRDTSKTEMLYIPSTTSLSNFVN